MLPLLPFSFVKEAWFLRTVIWHNTNNTGDTRLLVAEQTAVVMPLPAFGRTVACGPNLLGIRWLLWGGEGDAERWPRRKPAKPARTSRILWENGEFWEIWWAKQLEGWHANGWCIFGRLFLFRADRVILGEDTNWEFWCYAFAVYNAYMYVRLSHGLDVYMGYISSRWFSSHTSVYWGPWLAKCI